MGRHTFLVASFVCLVALARASIDGDLITSLPGWNTTVDGPLPKMYSGYIPVGNASGTPGFIHYWFILSQSDPQKDPVVYWTNGGPGGSGINAGLLTEMGLIHLNENSFTKDGIRLFKNPYAWSQNANMLYVSQPKGVGFSYCDIGAAEKCVNDDITAAQDAGDFFANFFRAFAEFAKNDFYLTAESYGGIYIPMFMDELDRRGTFPNLKGAAIGDGCWGTSVGMCNFTTGRSHQIAVEFYRGHSMYEVPLYDSLQRACGGFTDEGVLSAECQRLLDEMSKQIGTFDIYNIYDTCAGDTTRTMTHAEMVGRMSARTVLVDDSTSALPHPQLAARQNLSAALNDYPCGGDRAVSAWLKQPAVVAALHVKENTAGMTYNWGPASASGDLRPLYKRLAQKYRMLIYSGDVDACIPFVGTEEWTRELGFPVTKGWRPWTSKHLDSPALQRAGYAVDYGTGSAGGGLTYVTIQGAGHLVPTYKPHFALTMITKFLSGEEF